VSHGPGDVPRLFLFLVRTVFVLGPGVVLLENCNCMDEWVDGLTDGCMDDGLADRASTVPR